MKTKKPPNVEKSINLSSRSDDDNISTITIPDSPTNITINTTQSQSDFGNCSKYSEFDPDNLLFEVNFKSLEAADEFKDIILNSLRDSLKNHADLSIVEDIDGIKVYHLASTLEDQEEHEEDIDISGLFMVDTEPAKKFDAEQIPSYKRTIKEILDDTSATKRKKVEEDKFIYVRPRKSCFNCDGNDHDLRSCPKPRNMTKINKAKKARAAKNERYHVDIEQRFAHLRPGKISKKLRDALAIRGGELPFFFYRMRVLGYPPGWLEDAKVAHSGITLFDSEGQSVRDPDDEEGEIDSEKHKYDVSKIIAFPGFNADPGPHFYDDHRHHNVPPINPDDFKEEFIKTLGGNVVKGYKRKKLKDLGNDSVEKHSVDISEMEIDNDENIGELSIEFTRPPPPIGPPKQPSPPPLPPTCAPPSPSPPQRSSSPSLEDLEARQKRLLLELESNVTIISSENDDSLIDDVIQLESDCANATSTPTKSVQNSLSSIEVEKEIPPLTNGNESSQKKTAQAPGATAMQSVLGTPLIQFSPFDKLPCGDNFKVGVSDVINFENLPDSTGTYEKMKDVIKKVRTVITQLNSEDT